MLNVWIFDISASKWLFVMSNMPDMSLYDRSINLILYRPAPKLVGRNWKNLL